MEGWTQDIRYALRTLSRSRAFLTITVLTVALGVGANVAIFTLVNAVLLQPLPFREPDWLVRVLDESEGRRSQERWDVGTRTGWRTR
jgi:putative ABC transport system permease protein